MNIDGDKQTPTAAEETPTEPIEITITEEGADGGEGDKEAKADKGEKEEPKPKKTSGRFQRKIDHLTARASGAESTAQRLLRENEELARQNEELKTKYQTADRAALGNYEESVKANLANAKRAMVDATNSGDAEKIADATAEVSKWGAESGRLENWKKAHPEPEGESDGGDDDKERGKPEPRRAQEPTAPVELPPLLQQFVDDNPWFNPGRKDSPNPEFDLEMHQFARAYGLTLERKYKAEGKEIDQSYYDTLAKKVKDAFEYSDDEEEETAKPAPKKKTPAMSGDESVTPARSQQPAAKTNGIQGNKITLSPDERAMAWSMADNGAYKDPKTGKNLTRQEAEVRFARAVYKDKVNQQQKGA